MRVSGHAAGCCPFHENGVVHWRRASTVVIFMAGAEGTGEKACGVVGTRHGAFWKAMGYEHIQRGHPEWTGGIRASLATRDRRLDAYGGALATHPPHQSHCLAGLAH